VGSAFEGLDVRFEDRTLQCPCSRSRALVRGAAPGAHRRRPVALSYFRFWPERVKVAGVSTWVMRTGFSGELGFELIADPEPAWTVEGDPGCRCQGLRHARHRDRADRVRDGRHRRGLRAWGPNAVRPLVRPPREARCGVRRRGGARAVASAPPRRFKTLRVEGSDVPSTGPVIRGGEEIGTLTSPADSPRFGVIGLP